MDANNMNATPVTPTPENAQAGGNPVPVTPAPEPRKKGSGRFLFLLIGLVVGIFATAAVVLVLTQIKGGFGKTVKLEGEGYDTPEEAVTAYAEYLKAGDFDGIVSTFAMESREEYFSVEEFYERINMFSPALANSGQLYVMLGNDSDFATTINLENRRSYISTNVFRQLMMIMVEQADDEELVSSIESNTTFTISDDDDIEAIMDFLDIFPELEDMKIKDILDESDFNENFETVLKQHNKGKEKTWGGDIENVSLELKIDGEEYILFMTCVCYDDRWYIAEFGNYYSLAGNVTPLAAGLCPKDSYRGLD